MIWVSHQWDPAPHSAPVIPVVVAKEVYQRCFLGCDVKGEDEKGDPVRLEISHTVVSATRDSLLILELKKRQRTTAKMKPAMGLASSTCVPSAQMKNPE